MSVTAQHGPDCLCEMRDCMGSTPEGRTEILRMSHEQAHERLAERSKDALGDRMKRQYEDRTRFMLPRRTYTIVRVDGRAFHTYCRGMARPFDRDFMAAMDETAVALCEEMQGAQLAFVQSDEISVLLTDFAKTDTEAWFDGNLQKIVSISAATASARFNVAMHARGRYRSTETFDSRAFTIPDYVEVANYFVWRQQDATRNSISMAAQAHFSPRQLHGVNSASMQEMLHREQGINWNDYPAGFKRGRAVVRQANQHDPTRSYWEAVEPPVFTQERDWLDTRIPRHWQECDHDGG